MRPRRQHAIVAFSVLAIVVPLSVLSLRHNDLLRNRFFHPHGADTDPDYWTWDTQSRFHPDTPSRDSESQNDSCNAFPTELLSRIQVVLKIGSSEPADRLETQLSTVTRCISNLIVVSDSDQHVGPHRAHDILADLPPSYKADNRDLDVYNGASIERPDEAATGWQLDRFKFLPMVERAYELNPTAKWFVFLESDTYIVWDNMFRLLDRFDPTVPLYMGSPSPGRRLQNGTTTWFAYGGTGFVLSVAAAEKLVSREAGKNGEFTSPSLTEKYEDQIRADCCGDSVLGWALYEAGIELSGFWPLFSPHPMHSIPFSDAYWCQPAITAHKLLLDDMTALSNWEARRGWSKPLLYADLFEFMQLGTFSNRSDWDNADFHRFSDYPSSSAHTSFEACGAACHDHPDCFQYTYESSGQCTFVRSIRLGSKYVDPAEHVQRFAGWDVDKIMDWATHRRCEHPIWVKPSVSRIF